MKKFLGSVLAIGLMVMGTPAHAQFGGLLGGSKSGGGDVDAVIISGTKIIVFTTLATDLAVNSAMQMLDAFPPEKIEGIKAKFITYNELKEKRSGDAQLDGISATLASDGLGEMANLKIEDYQKGKSKTVSSAYTKMGLALGADGLAALQLPTFVTSGTNAISSLASNPFQIKKLGKLKAIIVTTTVLVKAVPAQIQSMTTMRALAKKIADAENIQLGEAKIPTAIDPESLKAGIKAQEDAG